MSNSKLKVALAALAIVAGVVTASAQDAATKVSINVKDATVTEFFKEIESQTDYSFSYRDAEIAGLGKVTVSVKDTSIEKLLSSELPKLGLKYTIVRKKVVITPVEQTSAAPLILSGTVLDGRGEPVIGAAVLQKGTTNGVITDLDGKFSIETTKGAVLEFRSLGFSAQEFRVGGASNVEIVLSEEAELLNEAIAVGYGTTSRKNLTTAIATIKADQISKTATSNLSQMLMGKAAGLRATISSPQPGGYVDVSIRGGGQPIYIVDGVMMPTGSLEVGHGNIETPNSVSRSGLAGLNPGDIESVEVLKDASAAIYGLNAANGVILITTKKGSEGTTRVSYEGSYSFVRNYHKYIEPLSSQEYMNFSNVFSKEMYLFNHKMGVYGDAEYDGGWSPTFYPDEIASATSTNWLDYILRPGYIDNQSVTITGGTKKTTYYIGGNFFDQKGTVINSGMTRYTLRTNIATQIFPFLKLTSILNVNSTKYLNSNADGGGAGGVGKDALQSAITFPPYYSVYQEDGEYMRFRSTANPAEMELYNDHTNSTGWYVNFAADANLYKDIVKFRALYGMNREITKRSLFIPSTMMWYEVAGVSRGHTGYADRDDQTLEGMIMYSQKFKNIVSIDAVAGMGWYKQLGNGLDVDYRNANDNIGGDSIQAAEGPFYETSSKWENERRSQFIRASVDVLDRYVVSAALRRDGTDKFFPGKKYSLFPSVSLAWKLSNEPFLKNVKWINLLKIRASYGVTGSDNLGSSLYGVYRAAPTYILFGENSTQYVPYLKSGSDYPDVTWQKTIMKNVGLDFHVLKDRLWGSVDFFRNDVTDLLGTAPGEPLAMVGSRPVNYGHYFRSGWDIAINATPVKTVDFSWTAQLTLTRYNMYWLERTENYDYQEYQLREKEPMNANYYYHVTGIVNADLSNVPASQYSLGEWALVPGYPIIEDRNGDDMISLEDIYLYDVLPQLSLGFGNTFTYKNWDLDIFAYGQFGATKYNYALTFANASGFANYPANNGNQFAYLIWNSQTNTNGTRPGIAANYGEALPGNCGTDIGREDASFLRIRNITLGYNFQSNMFGAVLSKRIDSIRLYVDFQNPFTISKYSGVDPEIYTGNSSSPVGYPMSRTYAIGAKINFK